MALKKGATLFIAEWDFEGQRRDELAFKEGDCVVGLINNGDGWWVGESGGRKGMFPANFTREATEEEQKKFHEDSGGDRAVELSSVQVQTLRKIKRAPLPKKKLAYGAWGYYMALLSSVFLFFGGICAIAWHTSDKAEDDELRGWGSTVVGLYCMALAIAIVAFEWKFGMQVPLVQDTRVPVRGIVQVGLSVFVFFSGPTIIPATTLLSTGIANIYAVHRGEYSNKVYRMKFSRRPGIHDEMLARMTVTQRLQWWWDRQREADNVAKLVILLVYTVANLWIGIDTWVFWANSIATLKNEGKAAPSSWAPVAKTCGQLLNINCALLILPILRGLLLKLNTVSCGRRTLAHYVPLRLNVEFHKLLALVVGGLAFFHVFAHFMNFAEAPVVTLNLFPSTVDPPWFGVVRYAPWVTGGLITWSMFYIYSAAPQLVRRAKYEVFWWNHHFFVLFYVAQIFHGPRFLYWTILPILLYILERILRVRRGRRKVYVKSVKWIDPVMCLELMPANRAEFKFVEGQYIYLNCPYISPNEWHPFTISSAAGDLDFDDHVLTVHIRVYPKGWTGKLKDYFGLMNPQNRYPLNLSRRDGPNLLPGKDRGVDGQALIRVDGPHAAPTQHYCVYEHVMLITAGIGLTPAAAVIRSILLRKWKKNYKPHYISFYWMVRQNEIKSFQWFVQLLAELEANVNRDRATGNVDPDNKGCEIHIYVTRVDPEYPTPELYESAKIDPVLLPHAKFDTAQLLDFLCHPTTSSKAQPGNPVIGSPNNLQDIWVWNGRPQWNAVFKGIKTRMQPLYDQVGVCFCGAEVIGKDLASMCATHSTVTKGDRFMFHLHKENF